MIERLRQLDLRQERHPLAGLSYDPARRLRVLRPPDEAEGDDVDPLRQAEAQVFLVLLGQGGGGQPRPRQVQPLVLGEETAVDDDRLNLPGGDGGNLKLDVAVVDEDGVAGVNLLGQVLVVRVDAFLSSFDRPGGYRERRARLELDRAARQGPDADLRPLEVLHDGDDAARLAGDLPHRRDPAAVGGAVVVGEVETHHVDPGLDELAKHRLVVGRRAEGGDYLRPAEGGHPYTSLLPRARRAA